MRLTVVVAKEVRRGWEENMFSGKRKVSVIGAVSYGASVKRCRHNSLERTFLSSWRCELESQEKASSRENSKHNERIFRIPAFLPATASSLFTLFDSQGNRVVVCEN